MTQTVAVSRGAEVVDATRFVLRTGHSPDLARTIGQMLSRQGLALPDVDELVVGVGPGSFTGLRIGLALAKGIAAVHGQPIVPVPSFLACAALLPPGGRLAVAVDARKRQVYAACMETGLPATLRVPVGAYPPADFAAAVHADADARPLWFCGSGFDVYADAFAAISDVGVRLPSSENTPSAAGLLAHVEAAGLVGSRAETVEPLYVRRAEAEEKRLAREAAARS